MQILDNFQNAYLTLKHSYLNQMTTKNLKQYIKIYVYSMEIHKCFFSKISLLLCNLHLIKQRYFSWLTKYIGKNLAPDFTTHTTIQSQKTQGYRVTDRVRKFFHCLIWIKEPCVQKFEGLARSEILWISQIK